MAEAGSATPGDWLTDAALERDASAGALPRPFSFLINSHAHCNFFHDDTPAKKKL